MKDARARWAEQVSAWHATGMTMDEYCKGKTYKASTLLWWERELRTGNRMTNRGARVREARPPSPVPGAVAASVPMARVVPVVRDQEARVAIEVEGAHIVVRRGFDAELLCDVVRTLRGAR